MSDATTPRPRYVVREKASKAGRGSWAVIDRERRRVDSRYLSEGTARQVCDSLNQIEADRRAAGYWPLDSYFSRWACITPEVPPAEAEDRDEVTPEDRRDWAAMSNQGDDQAEADEWDEAFGNGLLAEFDLTLAAYLDRAEAEFMARLEADDRRIDRLQADRFEEPDLAEFRR